MMTVSLVDALAAVLDREPLDLAHAALIVARIEHRTLLPEPTLDRLAALGEAAARRIAGCGSVRERVLALNHFLFNEQGFAGNRSHYNDFRNSLLNDVVERRLGIPVTLGLVYQQVARHAGVEVFGVSFPGHFLLRVREGPGRESSQALILDPYDGGRPLTLADCNALLIRQIGDQARFTRALLDPCTSREWLARILTNLKRIYVDARSFPHARLAADLLVSVEPTVASELRDRGLLAYHLEDYPTALRDLEQYLKRRVWRKDDKEEHALLTQHVKTIRERVAGLN